MDNCSGFCLHGEIKISAEAQALENRITNVEVSDTRDDDSSNAALAKINKCESALFMRVYLRY
jgi:hypothetical protein